MALAIAQKIFADIGLNEYEFASAGVMAQEGASASQGAIDAAKQAGLDLSGHCSKLLTIELVSESTLILTMTKSHKDIVCVKFPNHSGKVHLLSEYAGKVGDVPDPFGQSLHAYVKCRDSLTEYIEKVLETLRGEYNKQDDNNCDSQRPRGPGA